MAIAWRFPHIRTGSAFPWLRLAFTAFGIAAASLPAAAQSAAPGPSYETSLKRYCPARNLEFLDNAVLRGAIDSFLERADPGVRDLLADEARQGLQLCSRRPDDPCRTATLLDAMRRLQLAEAFAQEACALPYRCTDWNQCTQEEAGAAPDPAPPADSRQAQAEPTPSEPVMEPPPAPEPQAPEAQPPVAISPPRDPSPPPAPSPPPVIRAEPLVPPSAPVPNPQAVQAPPRGLAEAAPGSGSVLAAGSPRDAVAGFYGALARRDALEAVRFIVPEKRGRGAFSAAAMDRFYGRLVQPLQVLSIEPESQTRFRVRYIFTTAQGRRCDGLSIASTRPEADGWLVSSIRAPSRC